MKKLRVACVTDAVGLGGGETSLVNHLLACRSLMGIEMFLICPEGDLAAYARTVGIHTCTMEFRSFGFSSAHQLWNFAVNSFRLATLVQQQGFTILHLESHRACCCALLVGGLLRKPLCLTYHGFWQLNNKLVQLIIRATIQKAFVVSKHLLPEAGRYFSPEKTSCLPLALRPDFGTSASRPLNETRRQLGLPAAGKIILQVARFQDIKGQDRLLTAFENGKANGTLGDSILVFVGDVIAGSSEVAHDYLAKVRNHALRSAYSTQVFFVPFQTNIATIYLLADIVVVPSDYETFGMVVIEAMAMHKPVIATNCGGPAEIITDGVDGLLFSPAKLDSLTDAMARVLSDPALGQTLGEQAYITVQKHYTPETRAFKLLAEYMQLGR